MTGGGNGNHIRLTGKTFRDGKRLGDELSTTWAVDEFAHSTAVGEDCCNTVQLELK